MTDDPALIRRQLRAVVRPEMLRHFQQLALDGNHGQALALVQDTLAFGLPTVDVLSAIFMPVLGEVGELWHANLIDHHDQERVSDVCDFVLDHVWPQQAAGEVPRTRGCVLLAAPAGEAHAFAARLASLTLVSHGWAVADLGGDVDVADLLAAAATTEHSAGLVLHASRTARLPALHAAVDAARAAGLGVIAAGGAFGPGGRWRDRLGVRAWVDSPGTELLGRLPAPVPRPARVTTHAAAAAAEVGRRTDDLAGAGEMLDPTRFLLDELAATVLMDAGDIFSHAVRWYRGFLSSRSQPVDTMRTVLAHLREELADVPGCRSQLDDALTSLG